MTTTTRTYTAAEILAGISAALEAGDLEAVPPMLHMLAVRDPRAAQRILDAVEGRVTLNVRDMRPEALDSPAPAASTPPVRPASRLENAETWWRSAVHGISDDHVLKVLRDEYLQRGRRLTAARARIAELWPAVEAAAALIDVHEAGGFALGRAYLDAVDALRARVVALRTITRKDTPE